MNPRKIVLSRTGERDIRRLDRQVAARIDAALLRLARENQGDVRRLSGKAAQVATFRLRVGDWRVLFDLDEEQSAIVVIYVRPRGDAYTDL